MTTVEKSIDANIPVWLKSNLKHTCTYCGSEIMVEKHDGRYTQRYCSNPACPGHLAERLVSTAKYFGIKGVGPATALAIIRRGPKANHLQGFYELVKGKKLTVELWEVGYVSGIYGLADRWKDICKGCSSFEEVYQSNNDWSPIAGCKEYLCYAEKFFNVKPAKSTKVLYAMLTGSFNGYANREDFLHELNDKYGHIYQFYSCGKSSKADMLIKEPGASDHSKSAYAQAHDIPVYSPAQVLEVLSVLNGEKEILS